MRAFYAWTILGTQVGILGALWAGAWLMAKISRKLDRDNSNWDLLRKYLQQESDKARTRVDAIDLTPRPIDE